MISDRLRVALRFIPVVIGLAIICLAMKIFNMFIPSTP